MDEGIVQGKGVENGVVEKMGREEEWIRGKRIRQQATPINRRCMQARIMAVSTAHLSLR